MIKFNNYNIEFVGARKESYSNDRGSQVLKKEHFWMICLEETLQSIHLQ